MSRKEERNSIELDDRMTSLEKIKVISWIRSNMKHRKVKKQYMPYLMECLLVLNAGLELTPDQLKNVRTIKAEENKKRDEINKRSRERRKAKLAAEMKEEGKE